MPEIEIDADVKRIRELYGKRPLSNKVNFLIMGEFGSGKTKLAATCPGTVLHHSFDSGGTDTIQEEIKAGRVISDVRFENEDSKRPRAFVEWHSEMTRLERSGFFSKIGTYYLDSGTFWAEAVMNKVVADAGRAGEIPQIQDYNSQQRLVRDSLRELTRLPCHVVVTIHIYMEPDTKTGSVTAELALSGKLRWKIPAEFGEHYVLVTGGVGNSEQFLLQTGKSGRYKARTRIGANKFNLFEPADISALLKKARRPLNEKLLI